MDKEHEDKCHCKDWDPCCNREKGEQGPQGVQGPRGEAGRDGKDGLDGLQGPQGIQGLQGIPGSCVNCPGEKPDEKCHCPIEFAEVYSQTPQTLDASLGANQPGGIALLENTVFATSNIDVSQAASSGKVKINLAGWYDIATGICGALNPIESPLKVWTLSLFRNGVIVSGSTFACMTISPEQKSNETVADVFVHLDAGDEVQLANTSDQNIELTAPTLGTNAQPNSAYMKIQLLKAD